MLLDQQQQDLVRKMKELKDRKAAVNPYNDASDLQRLDCPGFKHQDLLLLDKQHKKQTKDTLLKQMQANQSKRNDEFQNELRGDRENNSRVNKEEKHMDL